MIKIKDENGRTVFVVSDDGSEPIQIKDVKRYHPFVTTIDSERINPCVCVECGMSERHEIHHYHETQVKEENK